MSLLIKIVISSLNETEKCREDVRNLQVTDHQDLPLKFCDVFNSIFEIFQTLFQFDLFEKNFGENHLNDVSLKIEFIKINFKVENDSI